MAFGYCHKDEVITGVEATIDRRGIALKQKFARVNSTEIDSGGMMARPLNSFFIKSISLPRMEKTALKEAIDLQIAYHLPYPVSNAEVTHQIRKREKDIGLVIVATEKTSVENIRALVPEPIALLGYANTLNLYKQGKYTLIVLMQAKDVLTVTLDGQNVVYMRSFPQPPDDDNMGLVRDLRLSCQEVYFRDERCRITPDQTIVIAGENAALRAALDEKDFGTIFWPPPTDVILAGDDGDAIDYAVPCGLAAMHRCARQIKGWNVRYQEADTIGAIKRGLLYSLPIWPIFLILFYYGDIQTNYRKLDAIDGKMRSLTPKYRQVIDVESDVTLMEEFMDNGGLAMKSPESWFNLIEILEASRPTNLWFIAISGKSYGVCIANGKATSYPKVTEFVKKLDATGGVKGLTLVYTQESDKHVDFQVSFRMPPPGEVAEADVKVSSEE